MQTYQTAGIDRQETEMTNRNHSDNDYGYVNQNGEFVIRPSTDRTAAPMDQYEAVGYAHKWESREDFERDGQNMAAQASF